MKMDGPRTFLDGGVTDHDSWSFAVGTQGLPIPGPSGPCKCVEVYVSTRTMEVQPPVSEGNTPEGNPYCEHGRKKEGGHCVQCKDPFKSHLSIDHSPYMPCTSGHGPRWLWDCSERGGGRWALCSRRFFQQLEATDHRCFLSQKWPILYVPYDCESAGESDRCNGYHKLEIPGVLRFSGWLSSGLPEGMCSVKWPDGTEFHGEFSDGEMTGYGRYIFADAGEYRGAFKDGLPGRGFYYPPLADEPRRQADYDKMCPEIPLWGLKPKQLLHEQMPVLPLPRFLWAKADCLAVVNAQTGVGPEGYSYEHVLRGAVTARVVWARPIFADQPLWNASECRGNIVVIMRGPWAPAAPCSYSVKLFHAQSAGAAAVIFVDHDSFAKFSVVPRLQDGPIYPGGPVLKVQIPCFLTLNFMSGVLQEKALHTLTLAPNVPDHVPRGWKIGFVICRSSYSFPFSSCSCSCSSSSLLS